MCGIAGILDLRRDPVGQAEVDAMAASITHRGPDDSGTFVRGPVGLANNRLAIIDVSAAGHQPMTSDDGRLVIVYNGELYNFRELARELESSGQTFRSRTDTEVVLRAWQEWGPSCLDRFDGMFAFAVWVDLEQKLKLARDRFGVKPLYYAETGGRMLLGSGITALLAAGLRASVSHDVLRHDLTFQNSILGVT